MPDPQESSWNVRPAETLPDSEGGGPAPRPLASELLGSFTHDLRTPLNTILGMTQLLASGQLGPLQPMQRELLDDVLQAGNHLRHLAEQYLDFSRTGRRDLRLTDCDPTDLVDDAVRLVASAAEERGLILRRELEPDLPLVRTDRLRVGQILTNYLSNAAQHAPLNSTVVVRGRAQPDGVRFEVEDAGAGVAEADRGRIFLAFQRGPRPPPGGSGLGLAIAASAAADLGGEVGVEGACFHVWLPRRTEPRREAASGIDTATLLRKTVDSLADIVEICDAESRFLYVNPAFERITGWTRREAIGRTPAELVRSDQHDAAFFEDIGETISAGRTWTGRIVSRSRQGELLPQDVVISPVLDGGKPAYFVAVKRDLRAREQLEARLDDIDRIAAEIAHQLNNPLATIIGTLQLMDGGRRGVSEEAVRGAEAAASTMRGVIRRLQLLGRRTVVERDHATSIDAEVSVGDGRHRVLVIDDDALLRRMIRLSLSDHDVTTVECGAEALERLVDEEFDVVLCDLMMPGLTGMEVYERAREIAPSQADRFVFISGGVTLPDVEQFLSGVSVPTLAKPFDLARLRGTIEAVAQGRRSR